MRAVILAAAVFGLAACAQPSGAPPTATTPMVDDDAPGKTKITVAQLLGQSDAWLLQNLGAPYFKRADRVANIWQYKNGHCVLNVFLYADDAAASAPKQVLHFDARDANGQNTDRAACLSALQD